MLQHFMAAMETLNFTTAAQNMHITQPAFSRNIAALEKKLGFPLFIRSKQNGLKPTPAAEQYYQGLKDIVRQYELLLQRTTRISRGEEGRLAVGIQSGICVDSLTKHCIQTLTERYPQVEVELICYPFRELIRSVEEGKIDTCLVLGAAVQGHEELCYENLVEVESYLAVPARLHSDLYVSHSLKEFAAETFILSADAPEFNELMINACRRAGFEPRTRTAPDFDTKMLWIEFGQGVAMHSKEHYIKSSPNVNFVRVQEFGPDSYGMIWQKDNTNPALSLFGAVCREIMESGMEQ